MKITVETRTHDYMAYVDDDKRLWGRGHSIREAIGDVIQTHYSGLGIEIRFAFGDNAEAVKCAEVGAQVVPFPQNITIKNEGHLTEASKVSPDGHLGAEGA